MKTTKKETHFVEQTDLHAAIKSAYGTHFEIEDRPEDSIHHFVVSKEDLSIGNHLKLANQYLQEQGCHIDDLISIFYKLAHDGYIEHNTTYVLLSW